MEKLDGVQVIVTIVLYLEEDKVTEKLLEIQNRIKSVEEIREFGFNIYDLYDPKLEK